MAGLSFPSMINEALWSRRNRRNGRVAQPKDKSIPLIENHLDMIERRAIIAQVSLDKH
jgi:hypothetical protein